MINNNKNLGSLAKQILDFYFAIYKTKFKEEPTIVYKRDMERLKQDLLTYNNFSLDLIRACLLIYLDMNDDDWLDTNGYPLYIFPRNFHKCRNELKYKKKFYKGTEEEFYKKYVEDTINKWGTKNVVQNGGNQPENTES